MSTLKIIGLLNWYDENPAWLSECVASAARICDHLIAVDGAYALFPGSLKKPFSSTNQAEAILRTASGAGMGVTVHASRQVWWGGEVEKRDFMFRLGRPMTDDTDWFLRIDADEVVTHIEPARVRHALEKSDRSVGQVWLSDNGEGEHPFRCLFRAVPGLRVEQAHYMVTGFVDGERRILRGDDSIHREEPAEWLPEVRLEHRSRQRPTARQRQKKEYGAMVDETGIERLADTLSTPADGEWLAHE